MKKTMRFAIDFDPEDVIEANAEDNFGESAPEEDRKKARKRGFVTATGKITQKGWDQLNRDILKIESNVVEWMNKLFVRAYVHGHDSESLAGIVEYDDADTIQRELIREGKDGIHFADLSYGKYPEFAFKGTSGFSVVIDGRLFFERP